MQGYAKHITLLMLSIFFLFDEYLSKTKTKKKKKKHPSISENRVKKQAKVLEESVNEEVSLSRNIFNEL